MKRLINVGFSTLTGKRLINTGSFEYIFLNAKLLLHNQNLDNDPVLEIFFSRPINGAEMLMKWPKLNSIFISYHGNRVDFIIPISQCSFAFQLACDC